MLLSLKHMKLLLPIKKQAHEQNMTSRELMSQENMPNKSRQSSILWNALLILMFLLSSTCYKVKHII